jgi:hypothetical protein
MRRFYPVPMSKEQSTPLIHPNALNARSFGLNQRASSLPQGIFESQKSYLARK